MDIQNLQNAQNDMRNSNANGALGILVSGSVWLASAFVIYNYSAKTAIYILLIGGVAISPITSILKKLIGLKEHNKNNTLIKLAMESTMSIPLAYGLSQYKTAWFYQGMLVFIGGRYLTFSTIFGLKHYWSFGASLYITAYLLFKFRVEDFYSGLTVGIIEIIMGAIVFILYQSNNQRLKAKLK